MSDDLLVASSGSVLAPPPDRCHFFVKRKKRNCRMLVKPGKKFCGEHALEKDNPDFANPNLSVKRIPCPYDPKHSCEEARLESHMLKCRAKPVPLPDYCEKGVNGSFGEDPSEKATTIGSVTDEKLMSVIDTIDRVFATLEKKFTVSILSHPVVEDHMKDPSFGPSVLKHLKQNSSILGLLESNDLLQVG